MTKLATIGLFPSYIFNQIENRHGFKPCHSCATQLITLTEDILHALDHQKQVDFVLLNFAKVFETVPYCHLEKRYTTMVTEVIFLIGLKHY